MSRCREASIGISPSKKYSGAMGEDGLSFNMPRRTLWWKETRGLMAVGLMGRAARPDCRAGLTYSEKT